MLTPTPQARAISAVSAPATRIAHARAILGSVMSGLSALMLVRIGAEGGVGDRVVLSALHFVLIQASAGKRTGVSFAVLVSASGR